MLIFIVSLKDASKIKREQILWGLQYLFWAARAKLMIFAADCVLTLHVSRHHPLNKGASSLRLSCVSSTDYPYYYTVLNADGRVHTVTCVRLFYLFPCTSFYTFHICASLFLLPFFSSYLFFLNFISIAHFPNAQMRFTVSNYHKL